MGTCRAGKFGIKAIIAIVRLNSKTCYKAYKPAYKTKNSKRVFYLTQRKEVQGMKNYNTFITARVTRDDLRELTAQARGAGRTKSEYMRGLIKALKDRQDLRREVVKAMEAKR